MKLLLDTSVLIEGDPPGIDDNEIAVASVTFAELAFGVAAAGHAVERTLRQSRLERLTARFGPGLPFDDQAATTFGHFCAVVLAAGRSPRPRKIDLMIAATAYTNHAGVVTRNPADFSDLRQLMPIVAA